MMAKSIRSVSLGVLALAVLTACGDKSESKASTQVAARVNGSEISVHQVNFALQQVKVAPEQSKQATAQTLERLIDQEVVVQKAIQQKLDRDPQVMQQLEAVRREVLQRAYAERLGSEVAKANDIQIKDYYAKHPELFAERRIYAYRLLVIQGDKTQLEAAQKLVDRAKNLEDLAAQLKEYNIRYMADAATRAAEQIPMQMLPSLHKMKDGQLASIKRPGGVELIQLIQSRTEPVSEEKARPVIQQYLLNQGKTDIVQKTLKELRDKASVEYMGEFKALKELASQSAPAADAIGPAPGAAPTPNEIEKGVGAGLKFK